MFIQSILKQLGISKSTVYRRLGDLKRDGIVDSEMIRGKARYFLVQNRAKLVVINRIPSEVDRLLIDECKLMVSKIISSGLLQPSSGEVSEDINRVTAVMRAASEAEGKPYPIGPLALAPEILDDNKKRRELRTSLLRQCETLHESLRWLMRSRDFVIPGWWGTDHTQEFKDMRAVWLYPDDKGLQKSNQGTRLSSWLEYYLGAIDLLSREETPKGKAVKTANNRKRAARS